MTDCTDHVNIGAKNLDLIETTLTTILVSATAVDNFAENINRKPTQPAFLYNCGYVRDDEKVFDREQPGEASVRIYHGVRASF